MNEQKSGLMNPPGMQLFFLVRHGSLGLTEKVYLGQTDLPLSPEGLEEARKLGEWFSSNRYYFDRIYTSPLGRCVQTLEGIFDGMSLSRNALDIQEEPDLMEINLGNWDGQPVKEIMRLYPEEYEKRGKSLLTYRTPGGESFFELRQRAVSCFFRIMSKTGNALIVAHAGVNRMILQECLSRGEFEIMFCTGGHTLKPVACFMQIPQPAASCYVLRKNLFSV